MLSATSDPPRDARSTAVAPLPSSERRSGGLVVDREPRLAHPPLGRLAAGEVRERRVGSAESARGDAGAGAAAGDDAIALAGQVGAVDGARAIGAERELAGRGALAAADPGPRPPSAGSRAGGGQTGAVAAKGRR